MMESTLWLWERNFLKVNVIKKKWLGGPVWQLFFRIVFCFSEQKKKLKILLTIRKLFYVLYSLRT